MLKRRFTATRALAACAALLALNAVLLVAQPGLAFPAPILDRLFGRAMIRAEVLLERNGVVRLDRGDRGKIRGLGAGWITLRERDGYVVTIDVAPNARVWLNGRAAGMFALRRGMEATVIQEGDDTADVIQVVTRR